MEMPDNGHEKDENSISAEKWVDNNEEEGKCKDMHDVHDNFVI